MDLTARQIAGAFSGHDFEKALPSLAEDVTWDLVGSDPLRGRDAVVNTCRSADGDHRIASGDLYDLRDGLLVALTFSTVELSPTPGTGDR